MSNTNLESYEARQLEAAEIDAFERLTEVIDEAIDATTDEELRDEDLDRGEDSGAAFERAAAAAMAEVEACS